MPTEEEFQKKRQAWIDGMSKLMVAVEWYFQMSGKAKKDALIQLKKRFIEAQKAEKAYFHQ